MRIINIIDEIDGVIHSVNSFPILEDQISEDQVENAENFFFECLEQRNIKIEDDDKSYILEDGYYNDDNGYSISIVWSNVNL